MSQTLKKQNLWISVVRGDINTISYPRRLEKFIHIDPVTKMIEIDRLLLTPGVFVGSSPMCPLRVQSDQIAPVFGLRFDMRNRCTIYGMGSEVLIGNHAVPVQGTILDDEDVISFGSYGLKVVKPLSDDEISKMSSELNTLLSPNDTKEIAQNALMETDFELRMNSSP